MGGETDDRKNLAKRIRTALRLGRAVRIVWQAAPVLTLASWALALLVGTVPLIGLYLTKRIVDEVMAGLGPSGQSGAFGRAAWTIALAGGVAIVTVLLRSAAGLVSEYQSQAVTNAVADILHAKSLEVDLAYYEDPRYYDTLHRAQQDAPARPMSIVNGLAATAQSGVSLLAMGGLLFSLNPLVAAVLFVAAAPGVLIRLRFSSKLYAWQRESTERQRKQWYYHWMLTDASHAKEVRLFGLGKLFQTRYQGLRTLLQRERLSLTTRRTFADLGAQALGSAIIYGTFAFIAWKALAKAITVGGMVMYFQAFQRGLGALQGLLGGLASLYEDNLFLANFSDFMELQPQVRDPEAPLPVPSPLKEGIAFRDVHFRYPGGEQEVLRGVSLEIRPGQVVALVGENGSGKTTLVKLLCRLHDPLAGEVLLDGAPLPRFRAEELRRHIAVIFQDFAHYFLPARENVWLGGADREPDGAAIASAAERAGADPAIRRLPRGYDTTLGSWFEDGQELSIGEWQKVALARSFFRDSEIVVLDEPTSSMDAVAEQEVFKAFRKMAEGRTVLLISHRFSTVKMADRIFVLQEGQVAESGSHEELLARRGLYAKMFEAQAGAYR